MNKIDTAKLIGLGGMILGGLATLISSWSQERVMEQTIEKKVEEALARREDTEEES